MNSISSLHSQYALEKYAYPSFITRIVRDLW
jgi:hypothetical protein